MATWGSVLVRREVEPMRPKSRVLLSSRFMGLLAE
jgi:hypothetical protein